MTIKEARLKKGYTLREVSEKIGVNFSTFSKWERGNIVNIKNCHVEKLCEVLDISVTEIMGIPIIEGNDLNEYERTLITLYRELSPKGKILLLRRASELLENLSDSKF